MDMQLITYVISSYEPSFIKYYLSTVAYIFYQISPLIFYSTPSTADLSDILHLFYFII